MAPDRTGRTRAPEIAAIGLGSSLGDRAFHLRRAVSEIQAVPGVRVIAVSSFVETEPVGGPPDAPAYLNGALILETWLSPRELLSALQGIEREHGRQRTPGVRAEPRTLDLDLLVFGDRAAEEPDLRIPHPRIEERAFVLEPLCEIAPDLVLPSGRTVRRAFAELHR
jgi:2-amino-4-hydroxy-6-hydroxymethyldihydropteridine diphosphokinase